MHAHQQNAFNVWWAKEHGTIDSHTGLVDALARAYGRAIWSAAIDAENHLPEAGKMVGEGIDWSAVYENKQKLLDKPSAIKDSDLRAIEKSIGVERTRTSNEEYILFYPSEYSAFVNALESLILATHQAVHPKDDPAALWAMIWRLRAELEAAQAVPAEAAAPSGAVPTVPNSLMVYITAYGDARSDDDGTSATRMGELITAMRQWAKSLATPPQAPPAPPALTDAEIERIAGRWSIQFRTSFFIDFARAIESHVRAALNGGQASSATPSEQQGGA